MRPAPAIWGTTIVGGGSHACGRGSEGRPKAGVRLWEEAHRSPGQPALSAIACIAGLGLKLAPELLEAIFKCVDLVDQAGYLAFVAKLWMFVEDHTDLEQRTSQRCDVSKRIVDMTVQLMTPPIQHQSLSLLAIDLLLPLDGVAHHFRHEALDERCAMPVRACDIFRIAAGLPNRLDQSPRPLCLSQRRWQRWRGYTPNLARAGFVTKPVRGYDGRARAPLFSIEGRSIRKPT